MHEDYASKHPQEEKNTRREGAKRENRRAHALVSSN
jgi:hypothetical protein